jgi:TldD protein
VKLLKTKGLQLICSIAMLPTMLAADAPTPPIIAILQTELKRNFTALKSKGDPPPYFLSYSVADREFWNVAAGQGSLRSSDQGRNRALDVSLRVGEPAFDNYHSLEGEKPQFTSGSAVPLEDDGLAVSQRLWLETDRVYKLASQRLSSLKSSQKVRLEAGDKSGDFSSAPVVNSHRSVSAVNFDKEAWQAKARRWSGELAAQSKALNSFVSINATRETKYFVSSEGSAISHGRTYARITIVAYGKATDGMNVTANESFEAELPERLPDEAKVAAAIRKVSTRYLSLLKAPLAEPFAGPALLSGRASAVFFHEIFGHRVEGHRQKDESEGQTFTRSVGQKILPPFLSVIFDPQLHQFQGNDLSGWYEYDDEGVLGQKVDVVKDGVLQGFLLSRSPIEGFPNSNGHGRKTPGLEVVARQSNMLVTARETQSDAKLREMLKEEIRRQNKPYGLFFEDVTSGYTTTGRRGLQAFTVAPTVIYKVYPDARPDELIRGADIVGTPLSSFSRVLAAGARSEIFNGFCGAESGSLPVSAVSPALLIGEVEIQKQERPLETPPVLPEPAMRTGGTK